MTESRYMARKACSACPFRTDRPFHLSPERAREFAQQVDDGTFDCHQTVTFDDDGDQVRNANTQTCVGGRVMLLPGRSRLEGFAEWSGVLRHEPHPDQPVFASIEEWLAAVDAMPENRGRS